MRKDLEKLEEVVVVVVGGGVAVGDGVGFGKERDD